MVNILCKIQRLYQLLDQVGKISYDIARSAKHDFLSLLILK